MAFQKISSTALIVVAIAGILLTLTTAGLLSSQQNVPSSGHITAINVGVYTNSGCSTNCTSINWGNVNPSSTASYAVYLKNIGNTAETLNLITSNWSPAGANSAILLSWDRENYVLAAGSSVQATITLTVSSNPGSITNFSFTITVTGTA